MNKEADEKRTWQINRVYKRVMPRPEKRNKKEKYTGYVELRSQVLRSFAEMRSNQQISHVLLMMYILYSAVFSYLCRFFLIFWFTTNTMV